MMTKVFIIFLCLSSLLISKGFAQHQQEVDLMRHVYEDSSQKREYAYAKDNRNEIQVLFSSLFLAYKAFISSQDSMSCSFHPSCSEFGMEAFKKQGAFKGIINTFDRLTRCHGLNAHNYELDPSRGLLQDPL